MTETQVPALSLAAQLGVPDTIIKDLTQLQQGWLKMSQIKKLSFDELQRMELELQAIVKDMATHGVLAEVQDAIKKGNAKLGELKDCRLRFTRLLDEKLITPSMEFEKRSGELMAPIISHELQLRIKASEKANEKAAYDREVALFKAHITNEYYRIAAEYRVKLKNEYAKQHISALEARMPVAGVKDLVAKIKQFLPTIPLPIFIKFQRTLIADADAMPIFKAIPAYTGQKQDLEQSFKDVDVLFATYAQDIANADAAIKAQVEDNAQYEREISDALAVESATNNLIAQGSNSLTLTGGAKLKKSLVAVIDNTEANAIAIVAGFMKNWAAAKSYLKVKSWDKLSIGQMAEALGKLKTDNNDLQITGLQFTEKIK